MSNQTQIDRIDVKIKELQDMERLGTGRDVGYMDIQNLRDQQSRLRNEDSHRGDARTETCNII